MAASELKQIITVLRSKGYNIQNTPNGGGWVKVAEQCNVYWNNRHKVKMLLRNLAHLGKPITGPNFYLTREWKELRYKVLHKFGNNCMCCGVKGTADNPIHV